MIFERLDAEGRLLRLDVSRGPTLPRGRQSIGAALFSAAGLDPGRFVPATPESVPPMSSDARLAWTGTYAENRMEHVRVEAASWQRRPVFFEVQPFPVMTGARVESGPVCRRWRILGMQLVPSVGRPVMARRNLRQGRSDRRGAAVIAGTAFAMAAAAWALTAGHVASGLGAEPADRGNRWPVLHRRELWLVYVALEPYVRRNWPDALVSWTRLCHGQVRNPVVASHILAGIVAAEAFGLILRPGFTVLSGGFSVLQLGCTSSR